MERKRRRARLDTGAVKMALLSGAAVALVAGWAVLSQDGPAPGATQTSPVVPQEIPMVTGRERPRQPAVVPGQASGPDRLAPTPPARTRSSR